MASLPARLCGRASRRQPQPKHPSCARFQWQRAAAIAAGMTAVAGKTHHRKHALPLGAALIAEGIGTFGLVFAGCGAVMVDQLTAGQVTHVGVSLVFGLVIAAMIYANGHIKSAHFNPAVTLGFVLARQNKAECDCWIEMRAADVAVGVNHGSDHQPEDQTDPDMGDLPGGQLIDHHRAASGKNKAERANALRNECCSQRKRVLPVVGFTRHSSHPRSNRGCSLPLEPRAAGVLRLGLPPACAPAQTRWQACHPRLPSLWAGLLCPGPLRLWYSAA